MEDDCKGKECQVPFNDAVDAARRWQAVHPGLPKAYMFHLDEIVNMVEQSKNDPNSPDPKDFRLYAAIKDNGETTMLLIAVDENGNDLYSEGPDSRIYDFAHPCPSTCDLNSPLNSAALTEG